MDIVPRATPLAATNIAVSITSCSNPSAQPTRKTLRFASIMSSNTPSAWSEPGFYFMDSPGNDLESVAGQIGAGCNMIFFTDGQWLNYQFPLCANHQDGHDLARAIVCLRTKWMSTLAPISKVSRWTNWEPRHLTLPWLLHRGNPVQAKKRVMPKRKSGAIGDKPTQPIWPNCSTSPSPTARVCPCCRHRLLAPPFNSPHDA